LPKCEKLITEDFWNLLNIEAGFMNSTQNSFSVSNSDVPEGGYNKLKTLQLCAEIHASLPSC
jgi:hypothetical protein